MSTRLTRVPLVDLDHYTRGTPAEREAFVQTFGDALKTFGFVRVKNHGVDPALIQETYRQFESLFRLPMPAKKRYEIDKAGQRGYVSFGKEHAKNQTVGDLKEFWHVGRELPPAHLASRYPKNVWPDEIPALKPTSLAVFDGLERSSLVMLEALADYFNIARNSFEHMVLDGNSILRAIHYPPLFEDDDPRAVRAAAHEDINLITLLCEATTSGLEILTREGEWLAIESLEGQIVVDAGDALARVTNDVIPATTHRVVNPADGKNVSRFSLPFFVHPQPDCVLECLPCCITKENPKKYEPITAADFLEKRLREIGLLKGAPS
jgi:isopenicillin N synthase-like dioxygenase